MKRQALIAILLSALTFGRPEIIFASNQDLPIATQQTPSFNLTYFTGELSAQLFLISADGKYITALWKSFSQETYELRSTSSTNGGQTFSSPKTIASDTGAIFPLQVEVSGDNVAMLWLVKDQDGSDLFLARSLDGGFNYSSPVNVSRSPLTVSNLFGSMIVDGSKITVFWGEDDGFAGIHAATSFDGGLTFGDTLPISNRPGVRTYGPWIAQGPTGHLYAAWQWGDSETYGIDFTRSTDYGLTFEPPTNVLPGHCCMRTLLATDGVIYLQSAWQPLKSSRDGGLTWRSLFPGISSLSTTTRSNSTLYVDGWIWHEDTSSYSAHIASSGDNETTFQSHELGAWAAQCAWGKGTSVFGQMAATWWTETDPEETGCSPLDIRDLVLRTTSDGGLSFGQPVRFPVGFSGRRIPSVFLDQNRIVVVWPHFTNINNSNMPLNFSHSTDGGVTFNTILIADILNDNAFVATQDGEVIHIISETSDGLVIVSEIIAEDVEIPIFKDGFEN